MINVQKREEKELLFISRIRREPCLLIAPFAARALEDTKAGVAAATRSQ